MKSTKKPVLIGEYSFPSDYVGTRKVEITAIAQVANGLCMSRVVQQLCEAFPEIGPYRYVILDRDSKFALLLIAPKTLWQIASEQRARRRLAA